MAKENKERKNTKTTSFFSKKKKKSGKFSEFQIPRTVQESIPYTRVYEDTNIESGDCGIIEVKDGVFTKSYFIDDTNYSDAGEERQEEILRDFEKILSTFNPNSFYEITINNRTIDQEEFNKRVLMNYQDDKNDDLRLDHNDLVLDKMQEGKNNLRAEKYFTIGIQTDTIRDAKDRFKMIENEIGRKIKKINSSAFTVLSLKERLEVLHDIYNCNSVGDFSKFYDLKSIVSQGITTKDIIGPSELEFKNDYCIIGDSYARVLFLKSVPSSLSTTILESLTNISTNVLLSVNYEVQPQDKATAFASAQVTNVGGEVVKAQKALSKAGADPSLISPRLDTAQRDAKELLADLTNHNQSLFHITVVAVVFAQNKDDLDLYTEQIKTRAKENICGMEVLNTQQEQGFNTALPLAQNFISTHRVVTTHTAAAFQPFSTKELQIKNGFYYGLNQLSKNLIIYNRSISINQNGVILGSPGAGKSFAAKMEMYQAYLNTQDSQIFIIDPEREYVTLAKKLGGTIFSIEPGGETHINPLDLDITKDKEEGGDPFAQKVDFIISIVESMLGGRDELNGHLKSIIDNTLQDLYSPYITSLEKRKITIDLDICPTLKDFHAALKARREPEARNLASAIEMYCTGSLDLFAYPTNIDTKSRMLIYDTKQIGTNLQELGMQICLNDIWNRMIANKKRNIRTWFYIDEFYLLLKQPSSAKYLQMVWKRARKWMGTPTGITQNIEDLLHTTEGQTILSTSAFALMLTQAPLDRAALAQIYNISEEQQEYITNAGSGEGLIWTSTSIVPFENHVPTDSPIYKLLSTKAEDAESIAS